MDHVATAEAFSYTSSHRLPNRVQHQMCELPTKYVNMVLLVTVGGATIIYDPALPNHV